ncbi:CRISPR system precrRNA processing endoribonuclease RAMP protein Cas6 [Nitrincola tibetensis]|nr:CRISPR system precrRNA processing endoribonuclease RAMP protein Cas6 [Nitrincola tibetensis]
MTRQSDCKSCPLLSTCPYPMIFETPPKQDHHLQTFSQMPNPYIIEPPLGGSRRCEQGEEFTFSMVLIGDAVNQLPLIILAWEQAFTHGLGVERSQCQLMRVLSENDEIIYCSDNKIINYNQVSVLHDVSEHETGSITSLLLSFVTPLRMQMSGKRVGVKELDARLLLITLARRLQLLCDNHQPEIQLDFQEIKEVANQLECQCDMKWHDWTRYSSRQNQKMTLGGLVGKIHLSGDLDKIYPLLHIGQWIHLGKNATFGLGCYKLFNN